MTVRSQGQASIEAPLTLDRLRVLRDQRRLLLTIVAVTTAVALLYSLVRPPTYTARATLDFKGTEDTSLFGATNPPAFQPEKVAAAQAESVTQPQVVRNVQRALTTKMSGQALRDSVQTSVDPASDLVNIEARAGNGALAARIANQFAEETTRFVTRQDRMRYARAADQLRLRLKALRGADPTTQALYTSGISRLLALSTFANPVSTVQPAKPPASPSAPQPWRDTLAGALLGLILGVLAAFVRDSLDRRLGDSREVQEQLDAPLVGHVHAETLGRGGGLRNGVPDFSERDLDAFRILRSNTKFLNVDEPLASVLVTSPMAEEGKSTVAAGIALASNAAGTRSLLLECDMRRPVVAKRLGVEKGPGLLEYLLGDASATDIVQRARIGAESPDGRGSSKRGPSQNGAVLPVELPCITVGAEPSHSPEVLSSQRFRQLLDELQQEYDLVVLDTAPLLPVVDTLDLIPRVDGLLMCVRLQQTTRDQLTAATTIIEQRPSGPVGVVVTGITPGHGAGYYGYYDHGTRSRRLSKTT